MHTECQPADYLLRLTIRPSRPARSSSALLHPTRDRPASVLSLAKTGDWASAPTALRHWSKRAVGPEMWQTEFFMGLLDLPYWKTAGGDHNKEKPVRWVTSRRAKGILNMSL